MTTGWLSAFQKQNLFDPGLLTRPPTHLLASPRLHLEIFHCHSLFLFASFPLGISVNIHVFFLIIFTYSEISREQTVPSASPSLPLLCFCLLCVSMCVLNANYACFFPPLQTWVVCHLSATWGQQTVKTTLTSPQSHYG